ncbi:MAG TPA: dimethyl sulfoxide reductase anchor subunit [Spirochaetota bacterium]|mgnify:CR=1 FL=1|nr:dimethyl sulfoxide reductase anchor subunit [Spirochaetota bacterium]HPJ36737.1 dimethyl sulfoxide reductase anchor subunit [Spirochaetota bacterium]
MIRKELSLIINSILVPLAAGLFIFLAVFRVLLSGSADSQSIRYFTGTGMAIAGPVILLGIIVSLFHLGNPFRAYRSVKKIDTSWLSREVFFTGSFFGLWLVYFVMELMGIKNSYVICLTILAGFLSIVSMANIYHSTGKPGWSGFNTYTGFLGSIIILGSVGTVAVAVYIRANKGEVMELLISSVILALFVSAARLIQQLILFKRLKPDEEWSMDNLVSGFSLDESVISRYKIFMITGWVLSFLGVAVSFIFLKKSGVMLNAVFIAAFATVLVGEFFERCGFYILGPE